MIELQDILQATAGRLHGQAFAQHFSELAFDSRRLQGPGGEQGPAPLFVAVKSDTGDGHDYIFDAVQRGATGVLCQRVLPEFPTGVTCIVVQDTRQALLDWAGLVLQKAGIPIVAVTGSSGKTIAKEAIAAVLSTRHCVFKNRLSYSGRYGLPIALGELEPSHRIAVLELAADSLNEVYDLARLTHPSIGVLTSINTAHIESLGSIETIEREKGQLLEALPADGVAVLNRDDRRVWSQRSRTDARVISFGLDQPAGADADYQAVGISPTPDGISFELIDRTGSTPAETHVSLRLLGRHHIYAALAAIAVGRVFGLPMHEIVSALAGLEPLPGRLCPIAAQRGAVLLDDSYDARPACTQAALDALADHMAHRNKIVVLGGVDSLAADTLAIQGLAARIAQVTDELVLKGESAHQMRRPIIAAGMAPDRIFLTFTNQEAARYLVERLGPHDAVLIKGARQERMEEIARALMQVPERAPDLLVRQEAAFRQVHLALPERPTWIRVDLEAIAHNLRQVRRIVGPTVGVMVVLKADGYGHGAIRIARTVINNGARMLGVACLSEGIALRQAGIGEPILILGYTPAWQAREAVLNDVTATLFDLDTARALHRAAGEVGRTARVHVKVDTGMGRLGLLPEQVPDLVEAIWTLPNLVVEGIFTHFSVADEADLTYTHEQLDRFSAVLRQLHARGFEIPLVHAANSAALLTIPEARYDMVRLGIALYGLAPSQAIRLDGFRPALAFETRIAQVKQLAPGSFVSYGNTYRTTGTETIAVIPVGYADGFRRAPSHWGYVLVRGQRAPIVGRVCMDQTMIDVTHIPGVRQGDPVVLIGSQGSETITVEQVAERLGTINYEVISEILARVPRVS